MKFNLFSKEDVVEHSTKPIPMVQMPQYQDCQLALNQSQLTGQI